MTDTPRTPPPADGAADRTCPWSALGHELSAAAAADGETAGELARRLAVSLSPEARLVLLTTLTGAAPKPGRPEPRPVPGRASPDALIRLRFTDTSALDGAAAAFRSAAGPCFGEAWSDRATLTLQIPGEAGAETLRAVLAVLDAAAVPAASLTVHTHALDDVFAACTSLP
ncbi:hypothetical protein JQK87_32310 [Streptomyces sp. G44]|uniref:hypothetical protein n=1 Tax=Streptomyces sp. G44 TaxID=2807632 RepID=UPI001961A437|nr:hypothetical protein [Streptomyces sp. G44]MBM7172996.1 hypothetical protein [Streptomyces sp. G44]